MIDISILNHQDFMKINDELETIITDLVELSLKEENLECDGEVSIMCVDDDEIHELNKRHREMDKATDVLSFPQYDAIKDDQYIDEYVILGDIVISTETAKRQSEEYNHGINREIGFLVVHSMFHLFGYDHDTDENTKKMRQKEETVLSAYNLTR